MCRWYLLHFLLLCEPLHQSFLLQGILIRGLKLLDVRTSTIEIAVKLAVLRLKNRILIINIGLETVTWAKSFESSTAKAIIPNKLILNSKTKEQNWPKNVIAFFLFLFRTTVGSKRRFKRSLLLCRYMWWKKRSKGWFPQVPLPSS